VDNVDAEVGLECTVPPESGQLAISVHKRDWSQKIGTVPPESGQ